MQYLLLLSACVAFLSSAYAIKCFACESVYESSCGENFEMENHFKYDCAFIAPPRFLENELSMPNATACVKRVFKEHGVQKFVRGCYFGDVNETDIGCRLDPSLVAVQDASCHVCYNENYCNGGESRTHEGIEWKMLSLFVFILASRVLKLG
ncbi:uncharacterized protein LOC115630670 [Scaptodrosophila lebanonensis]|uniref:Uncharacterized protein LOC115630670 n=1 Tax=Drosophila lebanonensis TaxID=7225 RepID=A0A6J2U472_DROLE|nr:uncharacterized protein LOC115630670 [Scaptodrosophila lebanonensis]